MIITINGVRLFFPGAGFPAAISPEPDLPKQQHDAAEEDPHILVTR